MRESMSGTADHASATSSPPLVTTQVVLAWALVPWTVVVILLFVTSVLGGRFPVILVASALIGLAVLTRVLERRWERRSAILALVLLCTGMGASLAITAGVVSGLGATILLLAAAYGFGSVAARWLDLLEPQNAWQDVPLVMTVGLASLTVMGILAGVLGVLTKPIVVGVCLLGVLLGVRGGRELPGRLPAATSSSEPLTSTWWLCFTVLLLIGFAGAAAPEVRFDALSAHLPIAHEFVVHHAIIDVRQNVASYFQLNAEVLYALGMLLKPGAMVPKFLHYGAGVLACLLLYTLGDRLWNAKVGLTAAILLASTPLFLWVGGTAYTDLWTVLYTLACVIGLARFMARPSGRRAIAVGVLAGAAVGSKLTSLAVALPIGAIVFLWIFSSTSRPDGRSRMGLAFVLGAALTGSFWFARAWVLTGNPIFPLLNGIFRSSYWPADNVTGFTQFGMGTTPLDLLLIPVRVTLFPARFVEQGNLGVAYLALFPIAILAIVQRRVPSWLWGTVLAGGLLWFFASGNLRYLLPLLPLTAAIAAAGLFGASLPSTRLPAGTVLILVVSVAAGGWVASGPPNFSWNVASGMLSRTDYAATYVGGYRVAEFVRRSLPPSARILGAGENLAFYYNRDFAWLSWYSFRLFRNTLLNAVLEAKNGHELQAILSRAGFTHLVVNRNSRLITRWDRPDSWIAREAVWEGPPRLEYANNEYYLFSLEPDAKPRVPGPELLTNPRILREREGKLYGWKLVRSGSGQGDGQKGDTVGSRLHPGEYLAQEVAIVPDRLYALEVELRSLGRASGGRLFIQWLGSEGQVLGPPTLRDVLVQLHTTRFAMACTAPTAASVARLWIIALQDTAVEVVSASFHDLR